MSDEFELGLIFETQSDDASFFEANENRVETRCHLDRIDDFAEELPVLETACLQTMDRQQTGTAHGCYERSSNAHVLYGLIVIFERHVGFGSFVRVETIDGPDADRAVVRRGYDSVTVVSEFHHGYGLEVRLYASDEGAGGYIPQVQIAFDPGDAKVSSRRDGHGPDLVGGREFPRGLLVLPERPQTEGSRRAKEHVSELIE